MTTINLKDFYPWYTRDEYIKVSEEVADELRASRLYEASYQRRIVRKMCIRDRPSSGQGPQGVQTADCPADENRPKTGRGAPGPDRPQEVRSSP